MINLTNVKRTDPEMDNESAVSHRVIPHCRVAGRPARILLAEDDREMRELLAAMLRADGFQVIESSNGYDMLQEIELLLFSGEAAPMDLIVSDERMPGMLGLEALACIREAQWPTPFILITGFGDRDTHMEAHRLGATAVFDKPFDLDDLRWTIAELLSARGSVDSDAAGSSSTDDGREPEGRR